MWLWGRIKQAVGKRTADAFVKENEQKSRFIAFRREPVQVALAVTFEQAVGSHLS